MAGALGGPNGSDHDSGEAECDEGESAEGEIVDSAGLVEAVADAHEDEMKRNVAASFLKGVKLNGKDEDAGHRDERREDSGEPFAEAAAQKEAEVAIREKENGGNEKEAEENFAVEEAEMFGEGEGDVAGGVLAAREATQVGHGEPFEVKGHGGGGEPSDEEEGGVEPGAGAASLVARGRVSL